MKVSDLKFTVELKSSYGAGQGRFQFPNDKTAGIALLRPNKKAETYKLKILLPEMACKKALIKPLGFMKANISSCSSAIQLLYQDQQGEMFKGYTVRPLGAYLKPEEIKQKQKETKTPYMNVYIELSLPFALLDTARSQRFDMKQVDIVHTGKHNMVIDITKAPIYVAKTGA